MVSDVDSDEAFASTFLLDGKSGLFLQRSNPDGVVVDAHYHLMTFESLHAAAAYALSHELRFGGEGGQYDLDSTRAWCRSPSAWTVDCNASISVWNLLNDVCMSIPWLDEPFRKGHYNVLYNKLFYGLNLPAITPEGRHWTPVWRESQLVALWRVLTRAVFEFGRLLSGSAWQDDQASRSGGARLDGG